MSTTEIDRYRKRLDSLFAHFNSLPANNESIKAHWARYLCIVTCGYIEVAVREILGRYTKNKSSEQVANYAVRQLERFHTPNLERILSLVSMFNKDWRDDLESSADDASKEAIDSIVNIRNLIAHGRDTDISYMRMTNYYKDAQRVINLLDQICQ